jgi:hypothetical protein
MNDAAVVALYRQLLSAIGDGAAEIEPRPLVSHWPHVGSDYRGLLIAGQAPFGWDDDWRASDANTKDGRDRILAITRARNMSSLEPIGEVATLPKVRASPFWQFSRHLVEALEPDGRTPWYGRYAWANLYPVAPEAPRDSPRGALKTAQVPFAARLLAAHAQMLNARRVVVIAGPDYWLPTAVASAFPGLCPEPAPLLRSGLVDGRVWMVGYHPKWASFQGWGASRYANLVADSIRRIEGTPR